MLFLESHPRLWLILHAIVGAATVAVWTHLVVWTRRYPSGDYSRHAAVRWFATVGASLYVAQFLLGNMLYPVYKVRVRAAYFDAPEVGLSSIARIFDIKEHWAALGLPLAIAACVVAWTWEPRTGGRGALLLVGSATLAALCAWIAALVGLVTTSYRSIGM